MVIHWNMDRSVLRNGGRKAPEIDDCDLEDLLDAALPHREYSCDDFEIRIFDAMQEALDAKFGGTSYSPFKKALDDFMKIEVDFENCDFQKIGVGSNGIPYAEVIFGGDWETPVMGFIYWDGKNFRGYLPTYGNSFNAKAKAAFGSESCHNGPYTYTEDGVLKTVKFASDDEYCLFCEKFECDIVANEDACIEDFSTRVVNVGKQDDREIREAKFKFQDKNQEEEEN